MSHASPYENNPLLANLTLGQKKRWVLADSLPAFLQRLSPLPQTAVTPAVPVNLPA